MRQKPGSPELPDLQHWQDTPPDKRQFPSIEEFNEVYGGTEEDVDAVVAYLHSKGLRILDKHAGHRRIIAEGSVAEMDAAFGIRLQRYRVPHRVIHRRHLLREGTPAADHITIEQHEHRGFDGPAKLPAALIGIVTAVIGLDDRRLGGAAGNGTGDPPGAAFLSPQTIAQRYNFPTNSAAGQTVGLFERIIMPEPCRSCDRRKEDFGGCRCQAFLLTGDARATDPVCELSPLHNLIENAVHEEASAGNGTPVSALEAREAPFHVLQEKMAGLWSYRTDPK